MAKPTILYAPVLGQSNAAMMRLKSKNGDSGIAHLQKGLEKQSGFSQVVTFSELAVGGSSVDGNRHPDRAWWFPNQNKPGSILLTAVKELKQQFVSLQKQGTVKMIVVWGQGESDSGRIGSASTAAAREALANGYMEATRHVFDYIKKSVSPDIEFFIMETGRYNAKGNQAAGHSSAEFNTIQLGLQYIDAAQHKLADKYTDVHVAADYDDLPMRADVGTGNPDYSTSWKKDVWHYPQSSYEIIGDRLAKYISGDLHQWPQQSPSQPQTETPPALPAPQPIPAGATMTGTSGNDVLDGVHGKFDNVIRAGAGNDWVIGHDGNDRLYGEDGNDIIYGYWGNDTLEGGAGDDILAGGPNQDQLTGGSGKDVFVIRDLDINDIITDFKTGEDKLDFDALLGASGKASLATISGKTGLYIDADGAGSAKAMLAAIFESGIPNLSTDTIHNLKALA